nr:GNAT family N-acetyltransferase [uncultured Oscillibacter sp.]
MTLRPYRPSDLEEILELFYETVHTVNAKDYTPEQLDAWADGAPDREEWGRTLLEHTAFVAVEDGKIAGFGDISASGYLDRLYVHRDFQRRGVASALCAALEGAVEAECIVTHASMTARPFFEKRDYRVIRERRVVRHGVSMMNYRMEKRHPSPAQNACY